MYYKNWHSFFAISLVLRLFILNVIKYRKKRIFLHERYLDLTIHKIFFFSTTNIQPLTKIMFESFQQFVLGSHDFHPNIYRP